MPTTPRPRPDDPLTLLRARCAALPEVTERISHGSPSWFVRDARMFVSYVEDHHGDGVTGFWCAAPPGVQEALVTSEPGRFFRPPYVGHRGWVGVRLDVDLDPAEVDEIVRDAYRCVAPKALAARLDDPAP